MPNQIDILVTLDEHYLEPLKVMLMSLHQNNLDEKFNIWLIHNDISQEKLRQLDDFLSAFKMSLTTVRTPEHLFADAPTVERYPKEMYYRLACGQILPESVRRVIYLDPDTLIINSIRPLWTLDLKGNVFAAAVHAGLTNISEGINNIRLGINHGYFNSGIMVIDVEQARQKIQLADIYETIDQYGSRLLLPDQDVMNYLYGDITLEIPEEIWNYDTRQSPTYLARSLGEHTVHWLAENTVILHFCGKPKPWDTKSSNRFTLLYAHYQQLTQRANQRLINENE